jgi:predicted transcriptional regulator of viral defense system
MDDRKPSGGDYPSLFATASTQQGHFTTEQAAAAGYTRPLLTYHTKRGNFLRISRGIYRLRDYPCSPNEEVMEAWLATGADVAVVSHESALALLGLSDVIPNAVHITLPRARRHWRALPGVVIHTTTRALERNDVTVRDGTRVTGVTRSILDASEAGTAPEQIEMAIRQAVDRGLTTSENIVEGAKQRSRRTRELVNGAVMGIPA